MSKKAKNNSRRDVSSRIASGFTYTPHPLPIRPIRLSQIEDNRRFAPQKPARALNQLRAPLKVRLDSAKKPTLSQVFADPVRTIVCIRRQTRKEVLHARGVAGRSGLAIPRYNSRSFISCKG